MRSKTIVKLAILTILILTLFLVGCSKNKVTAAAISQDSIKIPTNTITDQMQKFTHDANGVQVTYFAVRGTNGKIRTAFDACDVCGGHKGYTQMGTDVKCNNCGRVFKIDDLGTKNVGGGCWPSFLEYEEIGDSIYIKTSDLDKGSSRFA
jgi:uncharacterized membrane protein